MARMDWRRTSRVGRLTEAANPAPPPKTGCWSHVKREPVRKLTPAEIAAWTPTPPKAGRANFATPVADKVREYRAGIMDLVADTAPNYAITLAFNRDTTPADAIRRTRLLHAMLDRAALGRNWRERVSERSSYIAVMEHVEKNLHVHLALVCSDKHRGCIEAAAKAAWQKLVPDGSVVLKPTTDAAGWGSYMAKEITPETSDHLFASERASRPT